LLDYNIRRAAMGTYAGFYIVPRLSCTAIVLFKLYDDPEWTYLKYAKTGHSTPNYSMERKSRVYSTTMISLLNYMFAGADVRCHSGRHFKKRRTGES
jgi:hypothetical protein